jgi:hypothetical protein
MTNTLLDRHHTLPNGERVRLRVPGSRDRAEVHAFLARLGLSAGDLDVRRGLRFGDSDRWAVIATRRRGGQDEIVGLATVDASDGAPTLLADDPDVYDLLARALAERASADAPVPRVA